MIQWNELLYFSTKGSLFSGFFDFLFEMFAKLIFKIFFRTINCEAGISCETTLNLWSVFSTLILLGLLTYLIVKLRKRKIQKLPIPKKAKKKRKKKQI